jgi:hypothetical protein
MGLHYWNIDIDITSGTPTLPENGQIIEHHCLLVPELTNARLPLPQSDPHLLSLTLSGVMLFLTRLQGHLQLKRLKEVIHNN